MNDLILRAENISKNFIGVRALDQVSVNIQKGKIHCLAGENGSGKSTFVKTVAGIFVPDGGTITLNGNIYDKLSPRQAMDEGVQVIYQDLSLFQHMSIAENIAINRLRFEGKKTVDWKEVYKIAEEQLEKISVTLDLNTTVMETSMANRQLTAICRALSQDAKILFMDEPTAALTKKEVEHLLRVVEGLKAKGIAVVFISHKLDEVFEISDEITIFRDGKKIGDFESSELDEKKLAFYMTGRDIEYPRYKRKQSDDTALFEVNELTKAEQYNSISFNVRRGDILGMIGLLGSGRTELALSLFGLNPPDSGQLSFEGKEYKPYSPVAAKERGIALLPEDRSTQGLFIERDITENVSSAILSELSGKINVLDQKREAEIAQNSIDKFRIKTPSRDTIIGTLSGGNQQKGVIAKWSNTNPKFFMLDSPTVGIDIGSKAEIYEKIHSFANEGMGVLFITDEMEELLANCNRVLIMANHEIVAELNEKDLQDKDIAKRIYQLIGSSSRENREDHNMNKKHINQSEWILMGIIFLYCAVVSFVNPAFLSFETVFDIIRSSSTALVVGMGLLVVMLSGGIDVSFMSIALFGSYVSAFVMINAGINSLVFALAMSSAIGVLLGLINALLIHWLQLPPFIITLGTQNLFFGFMTTFISNKTFGANVIPSALSKFGSSTLFTLNTEHGIMGLSTAIIPVALAIALTWFIIYKTMIGRGIVALGNSQESAIRAGFSPLALRLFTYGYIGALAGIMGIMYISQVNAVYPNKLVGDELMIIAGAVIGGTKDSGGQGKILGVILGTLIIYLLNSTLIFLGLSSSWNNLFVGSLLVISVALTSYQTRRKNSKNLLFTN